MMPIEAVPARPMVPIEGACDNLGGGEGIMFPDVWEGWHKATCQRKFWSAERHPTMPIEAAMPRTMVPIEAVCDNLWGKGSHVSRGGPVPHLCVSVQGIYAYLI